MAHPTLVDELWKSMPQFHTFHQQFWGPSGQKRIEDAQMGDKILRVDEDGMELFKIIRATSGQIYLRQEMMRTLQRIKQAASSGARGIVLTGSTGGGTSYTSAMALIECMARQQPAFYTNVFKITYLVDEYGVWKHHDPCDIVHSDIAERIKRWSIIDGLAGGEAPNPCLTEYSQFILQTPSPDDLPRQRWMRHIMPYEWVCDNRWSVDDLKKVLPLHTHWRGNLDELERISIPHCGSCPYDLVKYHWNPSGFDRTIYGALHKIGSVPAYLKSAQYSNTDSHELLGVAPKNIAARGGDDFHPYFKSAFIAGNVIGLLEADKTAKAQNFVLDQSLFQRSTSDIFRRSSPVKRKAHVDTSAAAPRKRISCVPERG